MNRVSSDFLYDDRAYFQLLAGRVQKSDNAYKMRLLKLAVRSCVENILTDRQREFIEMYYWERLNIPQIAKRTGLNKSTVSRGLNAAKTKIYRQLEMIVIQ